MNRNKLASNLLLFYVYKLLSSFILDRAIWMLFLLSKGFSLAEIALIESAYHLTIFLFEVPTGYVADRYGKRISLLCAELLGIVSSCMLLWGDHAALLVIGFMLGGLVGTFQSGAGSAMIYETLKLLGREAEYKRYNSHLSAVMLVTLGIGGIAGGALSDIDWAWVYVGKAALSLLTFGVVLILTEPRVSDHADGKSEEKYSFVNQLKYGYEFGKTNTAFLALCVYGAILYSMSWSIGFYSQVVFQNTGLNNKTIGLLNGTETWISAAIAAVAFAGERWLGKRGSLWVAGVGFIVFLVWFSGSTNAGGVIVSFFMMAIVISYLEPLLEAYMNELLPSSIRATMLSVFSMLISAGMMITFSAIGFLADLVGLSNALKYVLAVWVPLCIAAIVWASVNNR
ncbi:MAG: transporter [Paenibacillus sp.]|nr:transporter [Paenibacillus sp.]